MSEAPTVQPQKAAYYPHFEFGSTAWVKNALLYWEGVIRLKRPDSSAHDDPEIRELLDRVLIEEIEPGDRRRRALPALGQRFEELIRSHGGHLPACFPALSLPRGTSQDREERVRAEIVKSFREYPLARRAFTETPDQARALFVTAWVDVAAQEKEFATITDDPMFDAAATYFEEDAIAMTSWFMRSRKDKEQTSHYLLSVDSALKSPLPGLDRAFHDLTARPDGHSSKEPSGKDPHAARSAVAR